ncbi:MAG: UDP-N-acetylglucosamine 1-carboxyvinyltransferase, partial [Candidatus Chisholmbacteria bacterium]|nr:UDP-N-acetylglucosamine 1-carboxyvinyltransferase [Candidatus Chisholmbacteria bacterium]
TLYINTAPLKGYHVPEKYGEQSRAGVMFVGPLLARFGQAVVPLPGGDKIGTRPLDRHFAGLKALGAEIKLNGSKVEVRCAKLKGATFTFPKKSHTGTETMIMAAVLASGETILKNAAEEPEVDDLIKFLNRMGAHIKRQTNGDVHIKGVAKLKPSIHKLMPDRNEAVTYAVAALATKGDIIVENAPAQHLEAFLAKVKAIGGCYEMGTYGVRFYYREPLKATEVVTQPHPGFMTDWQPLWTVLMTQAEGESIVHETVFTSRFQYVADLNRMGANIELFEPEVKDKKDFYHFNLEDDREPHLHAAKITGPTPFKAGNFLVPDIRAGATQLLAALIAPGKSILMDEKDHIDRGYEKLPGRLRQLGAKITES